MECFLEINQCKYLMFGMKAVPFRGDLARKADTAIPYVSTALQVVPLLAPEHGETAIKLDKSLGTVSVGLKATPYIANATSSIAQKADNALPYGSFGDFTTSSS